MPRKVRQSERVELAGMLRRLVKSSRRANDGAREVVARQMSGLDQECTDPTVFFAFSRNAQAAEETIEEIVDFLKNL